MTNARGLALSRQALRLAMMALCVLSLAACPVGYPIEDVPPIDPARMTQAQLLAALNGLGAEPDLGKRWRYALDADCELQVRARNGDVHRSRVALVGAAVDTRSVDGQTAILWLPNDSDETPAVAVLAAREWTDAVTVRSLLTHLEMRCDSPAARPA